MESRVPRRSWTRPSPASRAVAACPALAAALLAPFPSTAQSAGTSQAAAQTALLEPGSIANVADMDFGQIAQPGAAGTIVLSPQANATCTATGGLVRTGPCRAAGFAVMRRSNGSRVMIRSQGNQVTLAGPGGATMQLTNLTIGTAGLTPTNGGNGWNLGRYQITGSNGLATFWLGGTLHVAAAQAPGSYSGTLLVETHFN